MQKSPLLIRAWHTHSVRCVLLIAVSLLAIGQPSLTTAQSRGQPVSGTITFFGCNVVASDVHVRARPIDKIKGFTTEIEAPRITSPGVTPSGAFAFSFDDLAPGTIYRIGIKLVGRSAQTCPRFGWNVDRDPVVIAGDVPLVFEGYAVRSELEVLGEPRPGRERAAWVGADMVDFGDPQAGTRRFRWRTTLPGVTGGILQVALDPFPRPGQRTYDPCVGATNIVYSRTFVYSSSRTGDTSPAWVETQPVDFHALVKPGIGGLPGPIDDNTRLQLELGRPLYVRVIPTIGTMLLCDPSDGGLPSEALVGKAHPSLGLPAPPPPPPPPPAPAVTFHGFDYAPPIVDPAMPKAGWRCYRLIKQHTVQPGFFGGLASYWDFIQAVYGDPDGPVNSTFCAPRVDDNDDGWLESFVGSITSAVKGFIDTLGKIVDWASQAWEDIKAFVVKSVANAVTALGIADCPTEPPPPSACAKALQFALETGMASMGIPPSIPNFEALQDQGLDYLAAQVASQTNIPPDLLDLAKPLAKEFVKKATDEMRAQYNVKGLPAWLAPDVRLTPAVLTLFVRGSGTPLTALGLGIRNADTGPSPIFTFGNFVIPTKLPGSLSPPLAIPMVLPISIKGLPAPPAGACEYCQADWYKDRWYEMRFKNGCYTLVLTVLLPDEVIPLETGLNFSPETRQPCVK